MIEKRQPDERRWRPTGRRAATALLLQQARLPANPDDALLLCPATCVCVQELLMTHTQRGKLVAQSSLTNTRPQRADTQRQRPLELQPRSPERLSAPSALLPRSLQQQLSSAACSSDGFGGAAQQWLLRGLDAGPGAGQGHAARVSECGPREPRCRAAGCVGRSRAGTGAFTKPPTLAGHLPAAVLDARDACQRRRHRQGRLGCTVDGTAAAPTRRHSTLRSPPSLPSHPSRPKQDRVAIIDVRDADFAGGHIKGAINVGKWKKSAAALHGGGCWQSQSSHRPPLSPCSGGDL